jgi:hypothetical protein
MATVEKRKAVKEDLSRRGYSEVVVGNTVVFVRPISPEVARTSRIIAGKDAETGHEKKRSKD